MIEFEALENFDEFCFVESMLGNNKRITFL